jgi:hypothetical protein
MSRAQTPYAFLRPEHNLHFTEKIKFFHFYNFNKSNIINILRNKYQHKYIKLTMHIHLYFFFTC